jgi:hypothetical protein
MTAKGPVGAPTCFSYLKHIKEGTKNGNFLGLFGLIQLMPENLLAMSAISFT